MKGPSQTPIPAQVLLALGLLWILHRGRVVDGVLWCLVTLGARLPLLGYPRSLAAAQGHG